MPDFKKIILVFLAFMINIAAFAQADGPVTKPVENDIMASQGKIYVVMVIVITILLGMIAYVFRLDRKITKLEKGDSL
jgi:hypothetical protein